MVEFTPGTAILGGILLLLVLASIAHSLFWIERRMTMRNIQVEQQGREQVLLWKSVVRYLGTMEERSGNDQRESGDQ